jgi:hypothetical protein
MGPVNELQAAVGSRDAWKARAMHLVAELDAAQHELDEARATIADRLYEALEDFGCASVVDEDKLAGTVTVSLSYAEAQCLAATVETTLARVRA